MIKNILVLLTIYSLPAVGGTYAVYDATNHQQSLINARAILTSMTTTRKWLDNIIKQEALTTQQVVNQHSDMIKHFDKTQKLIGDPKLITIHAASMPTVPLFTNRSLEQIRADGRDVDVAAAYGAEELYGKQSNPLQKHVTAEIAYRNLENVLGENTAAKQKLFLKREALAKALDSARNLAEISKINTAMSILNSKLSSIEQHEANAIAKFSAVALRNKEQAAQKALREESGGAKAWAKTKITTVDELIKHPYNSPFQTVEIVVVDEEGNVQ